MYALNITEEESDAIDFVGSRYAWSEALSALGPGYHELAEHEAWELRDAFEADTEGGHNMFPMLSYGSRLAEKLFGLVEAIV